ncbi:MAG: hypothetical protein ACOZIN_21630 [Myxococcota bacterium]
MLALLAGLGLFLTACPPTDTGTPDGGPISEDCFEDSDCPDPQLFFCNTATSRCEPSCRTKEQCSASVRGEFALDYCDRGLGCQCDVSDSSGGKCVGSLCSSDLDCGSQVCRNGACVDPPAQSTITACSITPDLAILRVGAKAKFWVSAWAGTTPVVPKDGVTWTASNAAVTGGGSGLSQEFTAAATTTGSVDAITASIGGGTCKAKVIVLPGPSAANRLAVVVSDELSGRPISGATVLASVPTTGATLGATATTGAFGDAELTIPGGNNSVSVSVFHNDYNYLTIANYNFASTGPDARFLSFVLRRNQVAKYGGYKGTFNNVPATSNVHAGIGGMSIAGAMTDLSFDQLLGGTVPTDVKIGEAVDQKGVPLPAGAYIGFNDVVIKSNISAQGLAGVCKDVAGNPDETKMASGACGTRTAWALSGDVPLGDLPIDAFAGGANNIDFGKVLSRIIPIFRKFSSSIVRDVEFSLQTTPRDSAGELDFSGTDHFTPVNHEFSSIPLAFNFVVRVPDLPQFKNSYVDGVVLLGGAMVPGQGMVPLGLGAAVNTTPADAKTDTQSDLPSPGLMTMRMAPTHHGIEGADYGIVSLAVSLKSVNDVSAGIATSGLVGRVPQNQLRFDPTGQNIVNLPSSYLPYPDGAKYNFSNIQQGALGPRSFRFTSTPNTTGVSTLRVVFTDRNEDRWVVLLNPADAATGFTLPPPPGAFADRTFTNGNATGNRSVFLVQSLRLNEDPAAANGAAIDFAKLVEFNSANADRLADFTTGFAFIDYSRPTVTWVTPTNNGTVGPGGTIKVGVKAFKIGTTAADDGFVRVTFAGGPAACTQIDGNTETTAGSGEVSMTLPTGCTGANIQMTASLHDVAGNPLNPSVASTIAVNLQ